VRRCARGGRAVAPAAAEGMPSSATLIARTVTSGAESAGGDEVSWCLPALSVVVSAGPLMSGVSTHSGVHAECPSSMAGSAVDAWWQQRASSGSMARWSPGPMQTASRGRKAVNSDSVSSAEANRGSRRRLIETGTYAPVGPSASRDGQDAVEHPGGCTWITLGIRIRLNPPAVWTL